MELKVKTDQIRILEDFFSSLGTMDQRKIFTSAFKKASKPLLTMARSTVPVKTGGLRRSLGALMLPGTISILVGARKFGGNKGHHGHLVESGTIMRRRSSGGSTGRVVGTHFFENAFELTKGQVYGSIEQEWYKEIDKYIVRTKRKLRK